MAQKGKKNKLIHSKTEYIKPKEVIHSKTEYIKPKLIHSKTECIQKLNTLKNSETVAKHQKQAKNGESPNTNPHTPSLLMDDNNNNNNNINILNYNNVFRNYYYYISLCLTSQLGRIPKEKGGRERFIFQKIKQICSILLDEKVRAILLLLYMFDYNYRNNMDRLTNCADTSGRKITLLQEFNLIQRVYFDSNNLKIQAILNYVTNHKYLSFTGRIQLFELTRPARKFISNNLELFVKGYGDTTMFVNIREQTTILNAELEKLIKKQKKEESIMEDQKDKVSAEHIKFFNDRKEGIVADRHNLDGIRKAFNKDFGTKIQYQEFKQLLSKVRKEVWQC